MFLNYFRNIPIMSNTTINFHKHVQKIATSPFTFFFFLYQITPKLSTTNFYIKLL